MRGTISKVEEIRRRVEAEGPRRIERAGEIGSSIAEIRENLVNFKAGGIIAAIIVLAREAKRKGEDLIIGLETDWIPGYNNRYLYGTRSLQHNAINPLIKEIEGLENTLRGLGLTNVKVVHSSSENLAQDIIERAGKEAIDFSNVVVLGSLETIHSDNFLALRQLEEDKRPYFAGVDASKIQEMYDLHGDYFYQQLYINIVDMLAITLELALGKPRPDLPFIRVTEEDMDRYARDSRIVVFLPRPGLMDYNKLRNRYQGEKEALESA